MRSVRCFAFLLAASWVLAAPATAQRGARKLDPPPARPRAVLLQEIHRRLMMQARNQLGLTPAQMPRFQRVVAGYAQARAALEIEGHGLRTALREQVRPGGPGNPDSVSRLVDAINRNQGSQTATFGDEMRDLGPILNPVQRGQWQVLRDRWLQQVRALQRQRAVGDTTSLPQP
jgi:hypothetical protein